MDELCFVWVIYDKTGCEILPKGRDELGFVWVIYDKIGWYLAPEVSDTKKLSQASDVYSFRVVLLELLTRQQTILTKDNEAIQLVSWVASVVRHEKLTAEVFDIELLRYQNIEEEMVKFLQIALLCVDSVPGSLKDLQVEGGREMSNVYDNWDRLVGAVIRREELWQMFHDQSPSVSSILSDSSLDSQVLDVPYDFSILEGSFPYQQLPPSAIENLQKKEKSIEEEVSRLVFVRPVFKFEDMMRSNAEVLGNGTLGTSFKATLEMELQLW
ncbi:probable inactive receptor kinase At4g23740 [Olea europaea subsp. europaea]|uniref:Probable inactive receptor kinase At4g23740 n=1 Tax=Olea europaea subsp. europaea TaxID=158383 RepID=A0A8S0S3U3_OLEEU|nr:probable inactive receptor kinase At4g23740 [Olea europaea subsp. europaea]